MYFLESFSNEQLDFISKLVSTLQDDNTRYYRLGTDPVYHVPTKEMFENKKKEIVRDAAKLFSAPVLVSFPNTEGKILPDNWSVSEGDSTDTFETIMVTVEDSEGNREKFFLSELINNLMVGDDISEAKLIKQYYNRIIRGHYNRLVRDYQEYKRFNSAEMDRAEAKRFRSKKAAAAARAKRMEPLSAEELVNSLDNAMARYSNIFPIDQESTWHAAGWLAKHVVRITASFMENGQDYFDELFGDHIKGRVEVIGREDDTRNLDSRAVTMYDMTARTSGNFPARLNYSFELTVDETNDIPRILKSYFKGDKKVSNIGLIGTIVQRFGLPFATADFYHRTAERRQLALGIYQNLIPNDSSLRAAFEAGWGEPLGYKDQVDSPYDLEWPDPEPLAG